MAKTRGATGPVAGVAARKHSNVATGPGAVNRVFKAKANAAGAVKKTSKSK